MAKGFTSTAEIAATPDEVWASLIDFERASAWMTGIDGMRPVGTGAIEVGTELVFTARGRERRSSITGLEPVRRIDLTSTQGGVTATYSYRIEPSSGGTRLTLDAVCEASGAWKLLHPLIALAMKASDGGQPAKLKALVEA